MSAHVLQLDVPVLLDPSGPRLAASPAFSVWKNGTGKPKGTGDYTNYRQLTTEVSTESKNQILRWAAAYATGDSTALLAVTGDQDPKHRYEGLSGFRLAGDQDARRPARRPGEDHACQSRTIRDGPWKEGERQTIH
ncbi:hypothetical protein GCM10023178_59900 [Actinomadura luteofluorescens]